MLSKIIMELDIPQGREMSIFKSSLFHGAMMEHISYEYAEQLHESALKPFSQNLRRTDSGKWLWTVSALNEEAYERIIKPLAETDDIVLTHDDMKIHIASRQIVRTSADELFERNYYGERNQRFVNFDIETPVSFKNDGKYLFYPEPMLILPNLIHRFDAFSENTEIYEDALMDELYSAAELSDFNIRSTSFYLEKVRIPSFTGRITLKISGSQNLVNLVNMLADFAEYSGVGIKTALGMGAVNHIRKNGTERMKR